MTEALLLIWLAPRQPVAMQRFDSLEQCEIVAKQISESPMWAVYQTKVTSCFPYPKANGAQQ